MKWTTPWILAGACVCAARPAFAADSLQPADWDSGFTIAAALDRNPDPHVVEVDLDARVADVEIAPGERVPAWTYNGGLPGPLIRARAGDRLIVHFSNHLPAPTTIHWHGVRVPIEMDGVPGISQPEVRPGESFTYDFAVNDAGLFWYHPHVMSAAQVGFGLYGALLVDDPQDPVGIADELVIVLSDIAVLDDGTLESPDSGGPAGMAFGREGNRALVNGRADRVLNARSGAPQRWRVVNAAKSRYFQLDLGGQPFTTIGTDGGLQASATTSDRLVLAPGERRDVIVAPRPELPQKTLTLRAIPFNRGYGSVEFRTIDDLVRIEFANLPAYTKGHGTLPTRAIEPTPLAGATNVHIDLTLAQLGDGSFAYGVNGKPFAKGVRLVAHVGETQIWTIANTTKWSHPFHLHGFFFQVIDERGAPVGPLAWKDTVDVPLEQTVRLVVRFDDRPGAWMYHCHILDHADGGLMGTLELIGRDHAPTPASAPTHSSHGATP
jgi:FtsP/CotA-like multicopper oxidase with cupredoxin domain